MKRFLGLTLAMLMLISTTGSIPEPYLEDDSSSLVESVHAKLKLPNETSANNVSEPKYEHNNPNVRRTIYVVYVTSPCDDEWRSKYSSYMYEAGRTVERADDMLYDEFGIDLYSVAQFPWTSSSTTSSGLLDEAKSNHGLTYNGSLTAEMMIAFSGVTPSDDPYITGIANVGAPYLVVFDNGYDINAETTQHEVGHTYSLMHCESEIGSSYGDKDCVMTSVGFGYIDKLCTGHYTEWENNANKY